MQNGETLNTSNQDWDIAFSTASMSSTIRTNDGKTVELYTYQDGDTSAWNDINNSAINNLPKLMFNSDTSWEYGAFDINQVGGFDYGWGIYNLQTHHLIGDSLYLIKTINGNWKKLWIKSKILGEYTILYADLDGSNMVNTNIAA